MTLHFTAYIDEAGDEGLGKIRNQGTGQSKWLVLGGILVTADRDRELMIWRDEIVDLFPLKKDRDLHFRNLKHDQKVVATKVLADKRFGICCVCSNKITLLASPKIYDLFKQPGHLYRYLTRFLLERLTTAVRQEADKAKQEAKLTIVFSRRDNTDYHAMHEYLCFMRDGKEKIRPTRSIDWSVFSPDDIRVENHSKWAGLQIADVVTSATYSALEPNRYGNYESRYAMHLAARYLRAKKGLLGNKVASGCGLTLIPPAEKGPLDEEQGKFVKDLDGWRAPGP